MDRRKGKIMAADGKTALVTGALSGIGVSVTALCTRNNG